jgi:hypothetical protein
MSTIGAKVHFSPAAAASAAAMWAACSAAAGSQLLASPSGIGKIVRCPWITSKPTSSGIFSRVCSTAIRWMSLTFRAPNTLKNEPTRPRRIRSRCSSRGRLVSASPVRVWSWPTFSGTVIRASNSSILRSITSAGGADRADVGIPAMQRTNSGTREAISLRWR